MPPEPDKIQKQHTPDVASWDALLAELGRDIERVSDRLRGLSTARLAAAAPPHASRAAAARATAQTLADGAAGLEARRDPVEPPWRVLPELDDLMVGDQVAVTGHDLVTAAQGAAPDDHVWARHGRRTAQDALSHAAEALAALRHLL